MKSLMNTLASGTLGILIVGLLVFLPAGTFNYWQGWVFIAVIVVSGWVAGGYFLRTNPAVLQRRMPAAESRKPQKVLATALLVLWGAMIVVSAFDHRFGWSAVPTSISLLGNVLVAVGVGGLTLVLAQNSHAAVTIRVEDGQELVSTGLYKLVRHPMYTSDIFLLAGIPLALGSYWGLLFAVPCLLVLVFRIFDEERLLRDELDGYREYTQKVRYRMLPLIW
ncbi:methyltransferase family protein [Mycolicibacterium septicum]|uniref:Methyltransferase family protein n=1 Tax=Mycolicibacterium septicum TaxID=98668 RepID=A0ABW9LP39_9MYCO|nr:isoprenylcysteine carboxylmethyltransferase family protein [Mycobacteriaceae bacterium Msp059]